MERYKCHVCKLILNAEDLEEKMCPQCGHEPDIMCEDDCICHCAYDTKAGMEYCDKCGEPKCPTCGSHDVVQLSRVTGYLQEVGGYNLGKQQEVKDRKRYTVA